MTETIILGAVILALMAYSLSTHQSRSKQRESESWRRYIRRYDDRDHS